jgi:hypothetical protein
VDEQILTEINYNRTLCSTLLARLGHPVR